MIRVLTPYDYQAYGDLMQQMFELRYRVFYERMGWDVTVDNGREIDRYDSLSPYYFLALDDSERVIGTWRLLPTTGPYMLPDIFSVLMDGEPVPRSARIWECSRFAIEDDGNGEHSAQQIHRITGELFCGLIEYCLEMGIDEVVTVYDLRIARLLPRIGCQPVWKTAIKRIGVTAALAGRFLINHQVLDACRRRNEIVGSVLVRDDVPAIAAE
ncbi:MAG: acyl-homoserine-lactone synthase [Alphaproteobacteria bacterium]